MENEEITENSGNQSGNTEEKEKVGYGAPPKSHQFSSTNQPNQEQKEKIKRTRVKNKVNRDMLRDMLSMPYKFDPESKVGVELKKSFGEKKFEKLTAGQLMILKQMNRAILQGNTHAFTTLWNQAFGLPKQITELTGKDGETLNQPFTDNQVDKLIMALRENKKPAE